MVELGHFKNVDRMDRVCQICNKNVTETELHFVIGCEGLDDVRKGHKGNMMGEFEFKNLFKRENLKALACMLEDMFTERQKKITKKQT